MGEKTCFYDTVPLNKLSLIIDQIPTFLVCGQIIIRPIHSVVMFLTFLSARETSEKVQQAFRLFLNVSPTVTSWSPANDEFSLVFEVID